MIDERLSDHPGLPFDDEPDLGAFEERLQGARLMTTPELDARILTAMEVVAADDAPRFGFLAAAAMFVIGLGIVVWEMMDSPPRPAGPSSVDVAGANEGKLGRDPSVVAGKVAFMKKRVPTLALGIPRVLGVKETVAQSPVVAKVRLHSYSLGSSVTVVGKVVEVLKGREVRPGDDVEIAGRVDDGRLGVALRSALSADRFPAYGEESVSGLVLFPLALAKPLRTGIGAIRLNIALGFGVEGTRVAAEPQLAVTPPSVSNEDVVSRIRRDLFHALAHGTVEVRRSALTALRDWDGNFFGDPPPSLWKNPTDAKVLFKATRDPDPKVRWLSAWVIPESAGDAGEDALLRMLFDDDRMVRQPAAHHLRKRLGGADAAAILSIADYTLDEQEARVFAPVLDLKEVQSHAAIAARGARWQTRLDAVRNLSRLRPRPEVGRLLRHSLDDPHVEVRRMAALGLKLHQSDATRLALGEALEDEDGRVQVMAARGLLEQNDPRGLRRLIEIAGGKDVRAAAQAAEALQQTPDPAAAIALIALTRSAPDIVRAFAAKALQSHRKGRHAAEVQARLTALETDGSRLVRAAARRALE